MLARILENTNQREKFLHKIVKTECHDFALHCANDLSISKGFANLVAIYTLRHFSQFTGLERGCGRKEVPVHGIPPPQERFMLQMTCRYDGRA